MDSTYTVMSVMSETFAQQLFRLIKKCSINLLCVLDLFAQQKSLQESVAAQLVIGLSGHCERIFSDTTDSLTHRVIWKNQ